MLAGGGFDGAPAAAAAVFDWFRRIDCTDEVRGLVGVAAVNAVADGLRATPLPIRCSIPELLYTRASTTSDSRECSFSAI